VDDPLRRKKMGTATPDISEPTPPANPKKQASPDIPVDKFAAARSAKKKKKRAAHRVALRRSHTNG
jgi:hypothetical protein